MKKLFIPILSIVLLASFSLGTGIGDVINALKSGSASQVSKYFDATINITIADKSNSYSKSQGEIILRDFFINNPVKGFSIIHQGDNAGSQYCIGTLSTKKGDYRTTIYMKQKGNNQTLQEIRFEK